MRSHNLLAAWLFAAILPIGSFAQTTLHGMTSSGGDYGVGTIYTMTEAGVFTKKIDLFRYEGSNSKGYLSKANRCRSLLKTQFAAQ